jgi:hypothetical protein
MRNPPPHPGGARGSRMFERLLARLTGHQVGTDRFGNAFW